MKKVLTFITTLLIMVGAFVLGFEVPAQAASVKLSKKSVTLEVGKSKKIKVKNTKKKVTWSTSDKKVATVKNGKIKAKGEGTCTITAKVGTKTLTCKVTVIAKKTDFFDSTTKVGSTTFPKASSWTEVPAEQPGNGVSIATFTNGSTVFLYESVVLPENEFKAMVASEENMAYISDLFVSTLASQAGCTDAKTELFKENGIYYGKATGTGKANGLTVSFVLYFKLENNSFITSMGMDFGDKLGANTADIVLAACKQAK